MGNNRFVYKNRWRDGSILAVSSEHPQFQSEFTQDDSLALPWRSRYGTGSGNGRFLVVAGSNDKIDFCEDASTTVTDGGVETWASATDLTSWTETTNGASTVNREASDKHAGTYSARFDFDGSGSTTFINQTLTMTAGASYFISFWYKTASGKTGALRMRDAGSNVYLQTNGTFSASAYTFTLPSTSGAWARWAIRITTHASYTGYLFMLPGYTGASAASSSIYLDDIKIRPCLTATLTAGAYTGTSLAAEIKTRLDAAGATYTVTYDETTGKFTIAHASSALFSILWLNGANTATCAGGLLGFGKTADSYDAATYTSTSAVFHYSESIDVDLGSAYTYNTVALLGHNLTASASIIIDGADDSAFSVNLVTDTLTYNGTDLYQFLAAARTKRYVRLRIADPANPSGYVEVSTVVLGKYWEPNRNHGPYSEGEVDESEVELSPSANLLVTQERPALVNREIAYKGLNAAAIAEVRLLLAEVGVHKGVVFTADSAAPNTSSLWARFKDAGIPRRDQYDYWIWDATLEEIR